MKVEHGRRHERGGRRHRAGRARAGARGIGAGASPRSRRGRSTCWLRLRQVPLLAPVSTSTLVSRVVTGERSSWLTSAAKRASRWIRSSSASTMVLKEPTMTARSGSAVAAAGSPSRPAAMCAAAVAMWSSGATTRAAAARPMAAPPTWSAGRRTTSTVRERRQGGVQLRRRGRSRRTAHPQPAWAPRPRRRAASSSCPHVRADRPAWTCSSTPGGTSSAPCVQRGRVPPAGSLDQQHRPLGGEAESRTSLTSAPEVSRPSRTKEASANDWRLAVCSRCSMR